MVGADSARSLWIESGGPMIFRKRQDLRLSSSLAGMALLAAVGCGAPCRAQGTDVPPDAGVSLRAEPQSPFTLHDRFLNYLSFTYGPQSPLGPAAGALWGQAWNTPREWGGGWAGFGRRFASGYGRNVISNTVRFGVGAVDHEDPRYYPSQETRPWPRVRDAVVESFVRHTDSGGRRFAFAEFAGSYGAAFASNAWYPARQATASHALLEGSTAIASSVGYNVFREFWPDLQKLIAARLHR